MRIVKRVPRVEYACESERANDSAHGCNDRLEDVIQALFEGNPLLTVGEGCEKVKENREGGRGGSSSSLMVVLSLSLRLHHV